MTERLTKRSEERSLNIVNSVKSGKTVFLEWGMTIKFKKNPSSVIYGNSRLTLGENGKIAEQRDYYDLCGDIFDNIPWFGKAYRLNGKPLVYFAGFEKHIGFYYTPTGHAKFARYLSGYKKGRDRAVPVNCVLPMAIIVRIIKFRVNENNSIGGK